MAVPRVTGHPDYTAAGVSKFIPEIWSGKLLRKLYDATVIAAISNTDYIGEVKNQGDTVKIRTVPNVTINNYSKGIKLNYERLESPNVELTIYKGKYFAFTIDQVDRAQSDINLVNAWSQDASEQMKIALDTDVLAAIYADASAYNKGLTAGRLSASINLGASNNAVTLTKNNVLDYIIDTGLCLDECNIPETDRFMIIPAWMAAMIKKSDLKDASMTGDPKSPIRNGLIGSIDRFTLYSSNLLPTASDGGTCWYIYFGHKMALTFATVITQMETLKAESTFGDLIRGLNIFGFKVIQPTALGYIYAKKG
jgi:hypothetical protein